MPIVINGSTFNNGGTAIADGMSLAEIRVDGTTVWKKEEHYQNIAVTASFGFYNSISPIEEERIPVLGNLAERVFSFPVGSTVMINSIRHTTGSANYEKYYVIVNNQPRNQVYGKSYNSGQNTYNPMQFSAQEGGHPDNVTNKGPYTITTETRSLVIGIQGSCNRGVWDVSSYSETVYIDFTVT